MEMCIRDRDITLFDALCEADQIKGLGRAEPKIRGFVNLIEVLRLSLIHILSELWSTASGTGSQEMYLL